jgi:hypothetical protein
VPGVPPVCNAATTELRSAIAVVVIAVFVNDKTRVRGPKPLPSTAFTPFTLVTDAFLFLLYLMTNLLL